jgi:NADPH2:quinone reductase
MRAVVFERFGEPSEVLDVREIPRPNPGRGEVLVRMVASPVNPSDLLVVRGRYGVLPALPAIPGFEGVGVVEAIGPGLNALGRLVAGKRVLAINRAGGDWAEYAVIPARQARPVPADIPDEQAAVAFVNPATALAMVRHVLRVPRGAWLLQSAANSELGQMIVRLARHDGIRTINVVRRGDVVEPLKAQGADAVIDLTGVPEAEQSRLIAEQARQVAGGDGIRHAIDPVGGAIGSGLFDALGPGGRLLAYGSLSEQPLRIASRALIAGRRRVEGFWLGHFMASLGIAQALALFRRIFGLIRAGALATHVGAQLPLERVGEAVTLAESSGRPGKVVLRADGP